MINNDSRLGDTLLCELQLAVATGMNYFLIKFIVRVNQREILLEICTSTKKLNKYFQRESRKK